MWRSVEKNRKFEYTRRGQTFTATRAVMMLGSSGYYGYIVRGPGCAGSYARTLRRATVIADAAVAHGRDVSWSPKCSRWRLL